MRQGIIKLQPELGDLLVQNYEQLEKSTQHVVQRIRPSIWQISFHYPTPTNCWLLKEEDGLTLIDAGHPWSTKYILAAIESIGHPLRRIFITHAHPDHAGAANELAGKTHAIVMAHQSEIPFLQGQRTMANEKGSLICRAVLSTARLLRSLDSPSIERVQPVADGEKLGRLKVIHTPGHTPGSISLWDADEQALFCGDNLLFSMGAVRVGLPWFTLDRSTQNKSLKRYLDLPAQLLLSGHGPVYAGDVTSKIRKLI
jgi:glyoxylase-like metal-dependent hydrolase (beta-lactamase superfamily II)